MEGYADVDLPKRWALVKAHWRLLAAITLVAAGLALAVSLRQSERFQASAVLLFGGTPRAESLVERGSTQGEGGVPEQTAATNVALASLDTVVARVKRRLGTRATLEELKSAVEIEAQGQSDLLKLTAEWGTPNGAARVATTFAEEVVALRREMAQAETQRAIGALNQTIATTENARAGEPAGRAAATAESLRRRVSELVLLKGVQRGDVQLAEAATAPREPSSPNPVRNAISAGAVALILGLVIVLLLAIFDKRIRDEHELAALIAAPVLARIPEVPRVRRLGRAGTRHQDASFREAVQFLQLSVQRMRPQGESFVVAVTSPMAGDGKTMVVAWLAQSLAFTESEVVAVDCDLRSPMLHTYFDAREEVGGVLPNLRMVRADDHPVLPSGPMFPSGLIGQERLRETFDQLRDKADYVLVDTSPVSSVAHAAAATAAADGVILVVDLERIRRKDLLAAKEQLANAGAKIIGIVLNRATAGIAADPPRRRPRWPGSTATGPITPSDPRQTAPAVSSDDPRDYVRQLARQQGCQDVPRLSVLAGVTGLDPMDVVRPAAAVLNSSSAWIHRVPSGGVA